jgi:hypothetical protein
MTTAQAQALIEKLSKLPPDKLREVEQLIDTLRGEKSDVPPEGAEALREAIQAGVVEPPPRPGKLSSVKAFPPVRAPGRPLSEIVLEDRAEGLTVV